MSVIKILGVPQTPAATIPTIRPEVGVGAKAVGTQGGGEGGHTTTDGSPEHAAEGSLEVVAVTVALGLPSETRSPDIRVGGPAAHRPRVTPWDGITPIGPLGT